MARRLAVMTAGRVALKPPAMARRLSPRVVAGAFVARPAGGAAALVSLAAHGVVAAARAHEHMRPAVLHTRSLARRPGITQRQLEKGLEQAGSIRKVLRLHSWHGELFNECHMSACWGSLARLAVHERSWLSQHDPPRLDRLRATTQRLLPGLGTLHLANVARGMAEAGVRDQGKWSGLWAQIAREATGRVRECNPQDLANTVLAFANAGRAAPELFDAVAHEAHGRVHEFDPQELANTVRALATAGHAAPELFDAVAHEAHRRLRSFNAPDLANTVWAFAKAGHAAPELFKVVDREVQKRVPELNPQGLASMVWACARAGHSSPELFEAVAIETRGQVQDFNPQELADTVWAFATVGHEAPELFEAVAHEAQDRVHQFTPQDFSIIKNYIDV